MYGFAKPAQRWKSVVELKKVQTKVNNVQDVFLHPLASADQHVLRFHIPANVQNIGLQMFKTSAAMGNLQNCIFSPVQPTSYAKLDS